MRDKLAELDVRVTEYEPITSADLKATRTKDWESARKKVHVFYDDSFDLFYNDEYDLGAQ